MVAKNSKKKVVVTLTSTPQEQKSLWQRIKDFFYNSGNIMWNWLLGSIGAIGTALVGIFGQIDWSAPLNLLKNGVSFTKEQWLFIGLGTVGAGLIGYMTRVSGTKEVDGHLLPKAE